MLHLFGVCGNWDLVCFPVPRIPSDVSGSLVIGNHDKHFLAQATVKHKPTAVHYSDTRSESKRNTSYKTKKNCQSPRKTFDDN